MPMSLRASRGSVASGVRSRLVIPVPPVVRMTSAPEPTALRIASCTDLTPSRTTVGPVTSPNSARS